MRNTTLVICAAAAAAARLGHDGAAAAGMMELYGGARAVFGAHSAHSGRCSITVSGFRGYASERERELLAASFYIIHEAKLHYTVDEYFARLYMACFLQLYIAKARCLDCENSTGLYQTLSRLYIYIWGIGDESVCLLNALERDSRGCDCLPIRLRIYVYTIYDLLQQSESLQRSPTFISALSRRYFNIIPYSF